MEGFKELEKEVEGLDFMNLESLKSKSQEKHEAWLKQRRGKFTASTFHKLMTYEDNLEKFPPGAETHVMEKVIEMLTVNDEESYSNAAMEWGNLHEKDAIERFMEETGLEVTKYGEDQEFIELGNNIGVTPDGLISSDGGTETKCPNSKTHFKYLKIKTQEQFKKECKEYYWQIQGAMYVTNRKYWYFISYDPRFKEESKQIKILKIERNDEDIAKLKHRLTVAIKRKDEELMQAA